ncbi:pectinesterase 31-like isoform X2 [Zingiber officinale]|uniref:pectinesterase 31-like isoform X2 n=1 Tax=Zingiber officinale TaxID=94328 RepID=UPI001C4C33AC|nr:pectinesterase 31-like isoform X2 [Zingiber officinale]
MSCNKVLRVAADGSGDFRTVQEAVDAVPFSNRTRTVIQVAPGVYRQPVYVPKTKDFITLAGSCPDTTVLTWDNTASRIDHHQSPLVIGTGTFGCGSTIVEGEDFIAENITFENSAPQGSGQAVAIRVTADRCAFYNCRFLGWQDTLYLHYGKQYLRDCYIEGSVDFIFGNSTALLEHCHIHCKAQGFITAQNRKSSEESTDVLSRATVELPMHFLGDHGDPSRGLFSRILGWTVALDLSGGTTGINLRMNEAHASMSTDAQDLVAASQTESHGQENCSMMRQNPSSRTLL